MMRIICKIRIFNQIKYKYLGSILTLASIVTVATPSFAQTEAFPLLRDGFSGSISGDLANPIFHQVRTEVEPVPLANNFDESVKIKRVVIIGSTVFSTEELDSTIAPYINREATYENLIAIRSAITELYVRNGYTTSGAFLPVEQPTIQEGIVRVQIIEGQLEEIEIQGLSRLDEDYVRSRIERFAKPPLKVEQLVEGLQLLNLDPLIKSI